MKISITFFLIGILNSVCLAQQDSGLPDDGLPHGEMTRSVALICKVDVAITKKRIIQNLKLLEGVVIDSKSGEPKMEKWLDKKLLDAETIKIWWLPPAPMPDPKRRLPGKSVLSPIYITFGRLINNPQVSDVSIYRHWDYNAWYIIPGTEFPLWRGNYTIESGHLKSDREWLRKLCTEKEFVVQFLGVGDQEIHKILESLSAKD
jgi:hypothetical protein